MQGRMCPPSSSGQEASSIPWPSLTSSSLPAPSSLLSFHFNEPRKYIQSNEVCALQERKRETLLRADQTRETEVRATALEGSAPMDDLVSAVVHTRSGPSGPIGLKAWFPESCCWQVGTSERGFRHQGHEGAQGDLFDSSHTSPGSWYPKSKPGPDHVSLCSWGHCRTIWSYMCSHCDVLPSILCPHQRATQWAAQSWTLIPQNCELNKSFLLIQTAPRYHLAE